ncbi:Pyridoxamine 5'-phosphate oxidase [Actinopolyspora lacussalsi subsp. righensis]|uniref:Pyridoxamine 5'-phosphate oxidase n=1 Tax=Actinopolyspora righensis TaxID=995060 RepID=A0A1I6YBC0_9ACTN|nr:pyridoxamine 5'-phosphate oxidase family protein [Actinopolyspora righensis]SFT47591.1 Pyridoxamine 5'-phosphate oxidase [Actinopolyspora righensis]
MDLAMSREEREKFLAETHVGVIAVPDDRTDLAPLQLPIWYDYRPGGEIVLLTERVSRKAELIRLAGRFSCCVQDERPPYRYVSVEGPVVAEEDVDPDEWEALAHRYLDADEAASYLAANRHQLRDNATFRMRPEHWRTADFEAFAATFG